MTDQLYTIKPLRWRKEHRQHVAHTMFGDYLIHKAEGGLWRSWLADQLSGGYGATLQAAKNVCNRDYRRRMEKGLRRVKG